MLEYLGHDSVVQLLGLTVVGIASIYALNILERHISRRRDTLCSANQTLAEFERCAKIVLTDPETPKEIRRTVQMLSECFEDARMARSIVKTVLRMRNKHPRINEEMRKLQARLTEESVWLEENRPDLARAFTKAVMASVACACFQHPDAANAFMFLYINEPDTPSKVAGTLAGDDQQGEIGIRSRNLVHCNT